MNPMDRPLVLCPPKLLQDIYRYLEDIRAGFDGEKPPYSSEHMMVIILLDRIKNVLISGKGK